MKEPSGPLVSFKNALGKREAEFVAVLGDRAKWKRFLATAMVLIGQHREWLGADHDTPSLFQACMHAAESGLSVDPNLGHIYFVPRWNKRLGKKTVCFQMGYKGLLKLAYQSGEVASFSAECVFRGDEFSFELGTNGYVKHRPAYQTTKDTELTHVWAMAKLKVGGEVFVVLPKAEIDKAKKCSQSDGIWNAYYLDMCRKTALRRLCKLLHLCVELQRAIGVEEQHEGQILKDCRPVNAQESLLALAHEKNQGGGGEPEAQRPTPVPASEPEAALATDLDFPEDKIPEEQ